MLIPCRRGDEPLSLSLPSSSEEKSRIGENNKQSVAGPYVIMLSLDADTITT